MKNVVLIGMMGCGKSTVGRLLAHGLELDPADTDVLVEQREGRSIPAIFASDGEEYFRACEFEIARTLAKRENLVIACGGGLPTRERAISALRATGVVFWLDRDPEDIFDHVDMTDRPLAGDRAAFLTRARERREIYRRWADHRITAFSTPAATAAQIREVLSI